MNIMRTIGHLNNLYIYGNNRKYSQDIEFKDRIVIY